MTDDINAADVAQLFIDDHGVTGAIDRLQEEYEAAYDERAQRVLAVLKHIRQNYDTQEVEA